MVGLSSSQVSQCDGQPQTRFNSFSIVCVVLDDSQGEALQQQVEHCWFHSHHVVELCLIFYSELFHEIVIITLLVTHGHTQHLGPLHLLLLLLLC